LDFFAVLTLMIMSHISSLKTCVCEVFEGDYYMYTLPIGRLSVGCNTCVSLTLLVLRIVLWSCVSVWLEQVL